MLLCSYNDYYDYELIMENATVQYMTWNKYLFTIHLCMACQMHTYKCKYSCPFIILTIHPYLSMTSSHTPTFRRFRTRSALPEAEQRQAMS